MASSLPPVSDISSVAPEQVRRWPWHLIRNWIGERQQQLSDRVHKAGDEFAIEQGWTITTSTGAFGFGAREYRDLRFD